MEHKGTVRLETERLILRRFSIGDAPDMYRNWARDQRVTRFLTWDPHPNIEATAEILTNWSEHYREPFFYHWAIVPKVLGEPIGSIGATAVHNNTDSLEVGYCIGHKWWHQGYTSEAFAELIRFWFNEVKVNRIEATHAAENVNSGKVMQKCGLKYEGKLRQYDRKNGGPLFDVCFYAILAEDYFK